MSLKLFLKQHPSTDPLLVLHHVPPYLAARRRPPCDASPKHKQQTKTQGSLLNTTLRPLSSHMTTIHNTMAITQINSYHSHPKVQMLVQRDVSAYESFEMTFFQTSL